MGKFKVGQIVVASRDLRIIKKGDAVKVSGYARPTAFGEWLLFDGKRNDNDDGSFREDYFEAWIPAVGDRVAATGRGYGDTTDIGFVSGPNKGGAFVQFFDGWAEGHDGVKNDGSTDSWYFGYDQLSPAPLTIIAGRYYKTRDGRKVGPMEGPDHEGDFFLADHGYYGPNGLYIGEEKFPESGSHIIAEWVDEPAVLPPGTYSVKLKEDGTVDISTAAPVAVANDNAARAAETKAKFKVGDRVRAKETSGGMSIKVGDEVVLTDVDGDYVKFNNPQNGHPDGWEAYRFELITPTTPTAIVALIENGQPVPSATPKVHATEAEATKEAERLALKHPGQEFGVFVLADSKIADEVITKTAVLRAA
jgi:hypothetical protein